MSDPEMTKDEFCARFAARMLACVGPTDSNGEDVAEYAAMAAPAYWEINWQREEGPEDCADTDLSYWEAD